MITRVLTLKRPPGTLLVSQIKEAEKEIRDISDLLLQNAIKSEGTISTVTTALSVNTTTFDDVWEIMTNAAMFFVSSSGERSFSLASGFLINALIKTKLAVTCSDDLINREQAEGVVDRNLMRLGLHGKF